MPATILFLYGEDTFRSREKLRELMGRYIDASLGDTNLAQLDGSATAFDEFVRQIQALPFLAKTRLVVLKNLLTTGKKELQEQVAAYLPRIPASTVLVVYESGEPDKRTKLFKELNQPKRAQYFERLVGPALGHWLDRALLKRQLSLGASDRQLLLARVGSDLWRLTNELDKLAAYMGHNSSPVAIDRQDFDDLIYEEKTSDVFRLIEAIAARQTDRAFSELTTLIGQGEAELYLLSMIVYQFRTLILIAEAFEEGHRSAGAVSRVLKIAPFVAEKNLRLLRTVTLTQLIQDYRRILDHDRAIKLGELEPRLALELLIGSLTQTSIPGPTSKNSLR